MNDNARLLFKTFEQFRKLNIQSMMPNLSPSENSTLHAIKRCNRKCKRNNEKAKVSMIAEDIHVNPTQISRTLRSLEEKGLIKRSVDETDRRVTMVELTKEGEEIQKQNNKIVDEFMDAVFSQVDNDDFKKITEFLDNLYKISTKELEKRKINKGKEN